MAKGIQETKEMILFGTALAVSLDEALKDKFQWTDLFSLVQPMTKLPQALEGAEEILDELYDMSDDEKEEIVAEIRKLDFASDKSEEIAEQSLILVVEIAKMIMLVREAKKEE